MKKIFKAYTFLGITFLPLTTFAQSANQICGPVKYPKSVQGYLCELYKLVGQYLLPLLMLAATAFFMWNIVQYIRFANNEESRKKYRQSMIWGLFALFIMVSVWGIIAIFGEIIGINTSVIPQIR